MEHYVTPFDIFFLPQALVVLKRLESISVSPPPDVA